MNKLTISLIFSLFSSLPALSAQLMQGDGQTSITLEEAFRDVQPGDIVVLGEEHGQDQIAALQVQALETLKRNGLSVSVGMEFLEYPDQYFVDQYKEGKLSETDFLKQIKWGSFPFSAYKEQILFPRACGLFTVALNAPRGLTGKIAKMGLDSLDSAEKDLLPPDLTLGNAAYFERFKEIMGNHVPASQLQNYFTAQSVWDETMAWKAMEHLSAHPNQVLVIVVGEFHSQFGGGLPDRLKARGAQAVHTLSFVNTQGMTDSERTEMLLPSPRYGQRANFIWEVQIP